MQKRATSDNLSKRNNNYIYLTLIAVIIGLSIVIINEKISENQNNNQKIFYSSADSSSGGEEMCRCVITSSGNQQIPLLPGQGYFGSFQAPYGGTPHGYITANQLALSIANGELVPISKGCPYRQCVDYDNVSCIITLQNVESGILKHVFGVCKITPFI